MDPAGVPFAVAHDLQTFRLLELPPEIVDLLEAPDPPRYVQCAYRQYARPGPGLTRL